MGDTVMKEAIMPFTALAVLICLTAACRDPREISEPTAAPAASVSGGQTYARQACGVCHAVEPATWASSNPKAPAFAALANIPGMNTRALHVLLTTPHKTMPNFVVDPQRIDDLAAYIATLKKP
jgi:mono/diheme cytochrome c family protein